MHPPRLWHGGAPGRAVGDLLLPPSVTGIRSQLLADSLAQDQWTVRQQDDRVYVTSDRELARACAGCWRDDDGRVGGGVLYQVVTDDALVEDADLPGLGISFEVRSARVVCIVDAFVARDDRRYRRKLEAVLTTIAKGR